MWSRKNPKAEGGIRGYKKGWGVFVVFVGGGHRASIEKQKGEKVLRSKRVEKTRTQSERPKGEKVLRSSGVGNELHVGCVQCVQQHWKEEGGKSTTKYIGVGGPT